MSNESDTPTPRTDALWRDQKNLLCGTANLDFARTLERELNTAKARIAELKLSSKLCESAASALLHAGWTMRCENGEYSWIPQQPPAPQFLERPDAPGWWWRWNNSANPPRWRPINVQPNCPLSSTPGIYVRVTPPQWTPSEEGAK